MKNNRKIEVGQVRQIVEDSSFQDMYVIKEIEGNTICVLILSGDFKDQVGTWCKNDCLQDIVVM